jgi:hypothetical protein
MPELDVSSYHFLPFSVASRDLKLSYRLRLGITLKAKRGLSEAAYVVLVDDVAGLYLEKRV